ncbi:MAG: trimethylamine methyltransferase family protein [Acidimicrobiaceae bacterium]|jgi:trimethylamine---corrinoid protein Co-methyltransferase|nr:trimethylamine methyltransferase family protein [Acidimicrobiaceae bacterium]MBT5580223.1 trimethylamine methyltransferase family protein [Acidimicrobiaceae bacterium]MBT5850925.1 trimethylamine methyltransferase family protein [Acidimicrobiaceae bacterium]
MTGRTRRRRERGRTELQTALPLERHIPLYELLPQESVEMVHEASMRILEEVGIEFRYDLAVDIWRGAGADVDGTRVRIDRELLMALVSEAPAQFTLNARNPVNSVQIGGRHMALSPNSGSPFFLDRDGTRRYATRADNTECIKLSHQLAPINIAGGFHCEATDVAISHRHLAYYADSMRYTDKISIGSCQGADQAQDTIDMAKIVHGADFVENHAVITGFMNGNSPLVWDESMLSAAIVYARAGQPVHYSPFALAGANTPASTVGGIAQLNAEALAGCAFSQAINPGSPTIYGMFLMIVDMRTGSPMTGTPDLAHMLLMAGQLARFYGLPVRSVGMHTGSKQLDAQAGYEANMNMHAAILGGINLITHCGGWTEHGLTCNLAKYCTDSDMAEGWIRYSQGPRLDDFTAAMEAVREVGPAGHYLGAAHTAANYTTAFHMPGLMDQTSFEQWEEAGSKDTATLGFERADALLSAYEKPPMDDGVEAELLDFVSRRVSEIPAEQMT